MTQHDDRGRLRHMLDNAKEAVDLVRDKTRADLDQNRMLELSLVRLVEIVGEAAARITSDFQDQCPEIPWREVVAMRNRLVHGYDEVDLDILWDTVKDDLPPLIRALEGILK